MELLCFTIHSSLCLYFRKRAKLSLDQQQELTPSTSAEPAQDQVITTTHDHIDGQETLEAVACMCSSSASNCDNCMTDQSQEVLAGSTTMTGAKNSFCGSDFEAANMDKAQIGLPSISTEDCDVQILCTTFDNSQTPISRDDEFPLEIKDKPALSEETYFEEEGNISDDHVHLSDSSQSLLTQVLDAFTLTCAKLNPNSNRVQDLVLAHQRRKPLDKMIIIGQLGTIASMITEFASSLAPFKSLPASDKFTLLKCNIPLYLQYIVARYFTSSTGLEQLSWILEGQLSIPAEEEVHPLHQINLREYNITTGLFNNAGIIELYQHYSESIGMFYQFPQHCNGLIANLLLYQTNESMLTSLTEPAKIQAMFEEAKKLVEIGCSQIDKCYIMRAFIVLGPFIKSLEKMKNIFNTCQVESSVMKSSFPNHLCMSYTETEEKWLKNKFSQFQAQFRSVEAPADHIEEAISFLKTGTEVKRSFLRDWINMTKERMRRILSIHPEYIRLSDNDQANLFTKNWLPAVAISVSHMQLAQSGKDQIRLLLGNLDHQDTSWQTGIEHLESLDNTEPILLHNPSINKGRIDAAGIEFISGLMKEVAKIVQNDQIYQLFVLVILLDTDGLSNHKSYAGIMRTRQIYLKLFQRKLNAAGCSYVDYSEFQKTLRKLRILGNFLKLFFD
jgi:hypothetical protein